MRELLQKSPAVARVECRGARPGRRERKGAKGDRPEAPAAAAHRWWPRWPQHPVRSTGSRVPHSARKREAWGSSGSGLSRWRSGVRWHRRGTRASQRGLVAPPGWPRYPETRLRVALPRISKVRPRGSLARERSLRLRILATRRTAPRPHRLRALEPRGRYGSLGSSRSPLGTSPAMDPSLGHFQSRPLDPWTS